MDDDNDNDTIDYFTPCACARGNFYEGPSCSLIWSRYMKVWNSLIILYMYSVSVARNPVLYKDLIKISNAYTWLNHRLVLITCWLMLVDIGQQAKFLTSGAKSSIV